MKHKHYNEIVAFAEGKKIQSQDDLGRWNDWEASFSPMFRQHDIWRVKPEPVRVELNRFLMLSGLNLPIVCLDAETPNVRFVFEDGKLVDAEVIKS